MVLYMVRRLIVAFSQRFSASLVLLSSFANSWIIDALCSNAYTDLSTGDLKRICETDLGLISQCCLTKHVFKISKQYLANVSLKINVKVIYQLVFSSLDR